VIELNLTRALIILPLFGRKNIAFNTLRVHLKKSKITVKGGLIPAKIIDSLVHGLGIFDAGPWWKLATHREYKTSGKSFPFYYNLLGRLIDIIGGSGLHDHGFQIPQNNIVGKKLGSPLQSNLVPNTNDPWIAHRDLSPHRKIQIVLSTYVAVKVLEAHIQNSLMGVFEVRQHKLPKMVGRYYLIATYNSAGK
jgi:hypothetical protein